MHFFEQTNRKYINILWCLLVLFSASCNSLGVSAPVIAKVTPLPTSIQSVEYGASLSEWEEAAQTNIEQTANREETNTKATESQEMTVAEEVTSTGDVTDTTPTEEPVTPTKQTVNRDETNTEATEAQEAVVAETIPTSAIASDEVTPPVEVPVATPTEEPVVTQENTLFVFNDITYNEVMWDGLIPVEFTPDAIMAKYEAQLAQLEDNSKETSVLYTQMQEELNNAPVNEILNETFIRLPGFIAPLEYTDTLITEFLLVPYFGACIHVPPPPANQTVLVKTDEGYGIKPEEAYNPVWVMGKLTTEGATTELAEAGYFIQDAIIEPYTSP